MTVKKVLSIDMDYIVWECIQLYNDRIGNIEGAEGERFWDKINEIIDLQPFLKHDDKAFVMVLRLLCTQLRRLPAENFFFAKEHDMILNFLFDDPKKKGFMYDVYNVDHHHDIYYHPRQKEEVDRFDFTCLADWVYYMGKNETIHKYYWAKTPTSIPFPEEEMQHLTFPTDFETYSKDPQALFDIDFDYVFVCKSSEYFPKKFYSFFEAMRQSAEAVKGVEYPVCTQSYCRDGKSKHIK